MKPNVQKVKRKIKKPLTQREVKTNRAKTDKAFLSFLEEKKNQEAYERMEDPMWPQSTKNYNTKDAPALDIQVDTAKPVPEYLGITSGTEPGSDAYMIKHGFHTSSNVEKTLYCRFTDEKKDISSWVVLAIMAAALAISYAAGKYDRFPRIEYRDKVEFRYEIKELPENPWGPRKIPLLPEDVEILEGR